MTLNPSPRYFGIKIHFCITKIALANLWSKPLTPSPFWTHSRPRPLEQITLDFGRLFLLPWSRRPEAIITLFMKARFIRAISL